MMEDWVLKGMQRWPSVPALFGWLALDSRGRWLIRGELITRPQIIETIGFNYAADEQGRWYFQNGPQRGYVALEYAPLVLRVADTGAGLIAQTWQVVSQVSKVFLDEHGALVLVTDIGPGLLLDSDLPWALERIQCNGLPLVDEQLAAALERPSGKDTELVLSLASGDLNIVRLDAADVPQKLGFVREPVPDQTPASA